MKFKLFLLMAIISTNSFSGENAKIINSITETNVADFNSLFFTVGYKNGSSSINHNETSSNVGFTALNNTNTISNNSISLGAMKELFASNNLSFSILANVGLDSGKDKGIIQKSNLNYTDKLSGTHYSLGGSLNLNLEAFKLKIQPFMQASITQANSKYLLSYSQISSNAEITTIQYKNDIQQTDIGAGIRFIDPKVQLMSFLSINYSASMKKTADVSSTRNQGKVDLASTSNIELRPLTFTLGFGFFF